MEEINFQVFKNHTTLRTFCQILDNGAQMDVVERLKLHRAVHIAMDVLIVLRFISLATRS